MSATSSSGRPWFVIFRNNGWKERATKFHSLWLRDSADTILGIGWLCVLCVRHVSRSSTLKKWNFGLRFTAQQEQAGVDRGLRKDSLVQIDDTADMLAFAEKPAQFLDGYIRPGRIC